MGIKLAVIGGASSYTPELFASLNDFRDRLDVDRVMLMDPNAEKLAFIANVCAGVLEGAKMGIRLVTSQHYEDALGEADFIIMQIRVGGLAARIRDEKLPMEFGMVGNETTGAGGFACALRTLPAVMQIVHEIERFCPEAWLLNLANPAGIITEAILKHSRVRTLGFCNIPINTTYALAKLFGVDPGKVRLDSFGLNHLSWTRGASVDGEEKLQPLIAGTHDRQSILYEQGLVDSLIEPEWLRTLGMIPGWYLRYFYYPEKVLEEDRRESLSDGEKDVQAEEQLREIYQSEGYGEEARRILNSKGGAQYYLPVLQAIDSIVHDRGDEIVVDTTNGNAIPDLPPEACVEVPARIYRDKVVPTLVGLLPLSVRGLVQTVKAYEELTIEAALTGNQGVAIAALMANPLVGTFPRAQAFLKRVLENERDYLTAFFTSSRA